MQLSKDTIKAVVSYGLSLPRSMPRNLRALRMENFRRTLELDMENHKRKTIKGRRSTEAQRLNFPEHPHANPKGAARLEVRRLRWDAMTNLQKTAERRPGSLKK